MVETSMTDARKDFAALLDSAAGGERTAILRYGKPVAVVVPVEDLELLQVLEARLAAREDGGRRRR